MSIEKILARIEQKIDALPKPKPYWVNAEMIIKKTGWTKEEMRRQRINNPAFWTWKGNNRGKKKRSYIYDINLVPGILINKKDK